MKYRLLVDLEVCDWLTGLSPSLRREFRAQFERILDYPGAHTDYHETDAKGRLLNVNLHRGVAIKFWDDSADRHIKILEVAPADC